MQEIDNSLLTDGISRLYFNALKITRGQFYSKAPQASFCTDIIAKKTLCVFVHEVGSRLKNLGKV